MFVALKSFFLLHLFVLFSLFLSPLFLFLSFSKLRATNVSLVAVCIKFIYNSVHCCVLSLPKYNDRNVKLTKQSLLVLSLHKNKNE